MLDQGPNDNQQEQLAAHRQLLALRLRQLAAIGSSHVPPEVVTAIKEAPTAIRRIKDDSRAGGAIVADHPTDAAPADDEDTMPPARQGPRRRSLLQSQIVWGFIVLVILLLSAI